jgi:hypothetical protein
MPVTTEILIKGPRVKSESDLMFIEKKSNRPKLEKSRWSISLTGEAYQALS